MLDKELRRLGLPPAEWQDEVQRLFKFDTLDDLLAAVGDGGVNTERIALRLAPLLEQDRDEIAPTAPTYREPTVPVGGITVLGAGDLLTQLAQCCRPVPGDAIMGFVTRSRGVSIHRADCSNIVNASERERIVDVSWGTPKQQYPVAVLVEAYDRVGLLRDLSAVVAEEKVNISAVRTDEHADHTITVYLTLATTGLEQLTRLLHRLESIQGVQSVVRSRGSVRASA